MEFGFNDAGLTDAELLRIDRAEALAYQDLHAVSAAKLGTGSERIGDSTAIWYPDEEDAGYNCLVNFHLARDRDEAYFAALDRVRRAGSKVFGIPVDERVQDWATPERIAALGLSHESSETIWGGRIDPCESLELPVAPDGIIVGSPDLDDDALARLINLGWNLEPDDARGKLFSSSIRIPGWKVYLARDRNEVAGVSVFCSYEGVGLLMLAVVLPSFRGRGLQSYFIGARLAEAATRECTLAISETDDDNSSPRNLQRAGFRFCVRRELYSRPI